MSATSSPSTASAAMVSSAAVSSQLLPAMSASTRQRLAMQRLSGPRRPTPAAGKRLARAPAPRDAVEGGRRLSVRPSEQAKDEDELIRELRSQLKAQQVVISEQGQLLEQLSGCQGVDPAACPPLAAAAAPAAPPRRPPTPDTRTQAPLPLPPPRRQPPPGTLIVARRAIRSRPQSRRAFARIARAVDGSTDTPCSVSASATGSRFPHTPRMRRAVRHRSLTFDL